jgi:uncharacterized protein YndB with AHSA1/START domain
MRIDQTFEVAARPESVFDYMTDPSNLQQWQTSKTRVEVLSEGEPIVQRAVDRQFREYHENLRRNV